MKLNVFTFVHKNLSESKKIGEVICLMDTKIWYLKKIFVSLDLPMAWKTVAAGNP